MVLRQSIFGSFLKHALFSARTLFWHLEQVYMLSPSNMSFTVTSSRDSCRAKRQQVVYKVQGLLQGKKATSK